MAYNTKAIVKDVNQKPIPQYFNPATDDFEDLRGRNGASYTDGETWAKIRVLKIKEKEWL